VRGDTEHVVSELLRKREELICIKSDVHWIGEINGDCLCNGWRVMHRRSSSVVSCIMPVIVVVVVVVAGSTPLVVAGDVIIIPS